MSPDFQAHPTPANNAAGRTSESARAEELFRAHQNRANRKTDRVFAQLMTVQWLAGILFALWVSPLAWSGTVSQAHIHVWAAIFLGGVITIFPALLGIFRRARRRRATRSPSRRC